MTEVGKPRDLATKLSIAHQRHEAAFRERR